MSAGAAAGANAGAAAAAAAALQAIKASGVIVRVDPEAFFELLHRIELPLVIHAQRTVMFSRRHVYMTAHRGFVFHAELAQPVELPDYCEVVEARKVWLPT